MKAPQPSNIVTELAEIDLRLVMLSDEYKANRFDLEKKADSLKRINRYLDRRNQLTNV